VWADTAYRTQRNLQALQRRGLRGSGQAREPDLALQVADVKLHHARLDDPSG
jgi:hypothetical protein